MIASVIETFIPVKGGINVLTVTRLSVVPMRLNDTWSVGVPEWKTMILRNLIATGTERRDETSEVAWEALMSIRKIITPVPVDTIDLPFYLYTIFIIILQWI
jgi:hypothetical protein